MRHNNNNNNNNKIDEDRMTAPIRCHYEVLGVSRDADTSAIKKAHRKLALKHHPDKNHGDEAAAEQFRLVQQAYEVLSDSQERKWYDDHREALLAGWTTSGGDEAQAAATMLFDVVHFMHPSCYSGYHEEKGGFFRVYQTVFEEIVQCERRQTEVSIELPVEFGSSGTDWSVVSSFYQSWESFGSQLNFAWEDKYNVREDAPNRRIRRLMEEDNKKARRAAKKTYNQDILALVAFVKRRDPRVKKKQVELERQKAEEAKHKEQEAAERKRENQKAKEAWREQAQRELEEAEEADRLAGRVRLADLEDDYDYGGGKKRGKKKKNKRRGQLHEEEEQVKEEHDFGLGGLLPSETTEDGEPPEQELTSEIASEMVEDNNEEAHAQNVAEEEASSGDQCTPVPLVNDDEFDSESEESEEPDVWRCEVCRKDFKSEAQMKNHEKSKKHKEKLKKYQAKLKQEEEDIMAQMMDELDLEE